MKTKLIVLALGILALASRTPAQTTVTNLTGVYHGSYAGPRGTTSFTLSLIVKDEQGNLTGVLTSQPAGSLATVVSTNDLVGNFTEKTHHLQLHTKPDRSAPRRTGSETVLINVTVDSNAGQLSGQLLPFRGRRRKFEATRDAAASAELARANPAPVAPTAEQIERRLMAAHTVTNSADITGVYAGTYDSPEGPASFTLSLIEVKGRGGNLAGVFTSHLAGHLDAVGSTTELNGSYSGRNMELQPSFNRMVSSARPTIWFIRGAYQAAGIQGAAQFSGEMMMPRKAPIKFAAIRDEAASAKLASLQPTPAAPALVVHKLNDPAVITGVYTGTYAIAQSPRTLKLALQASSKGTMVAVFTFSTETASHTQTFSFSLNGTLDAATGRFKLHAVKWETPPPPNPTMVGMDGLFNPDTGQVTGEIISWNQGTFQATRDPSASVNAATVIAELEARGTYRGVAFARAGTIPRAGTNSGMEIQVYDRMDSRDQAEYVNQLIANLEAGCARNRTQLAQVQQFFWSNPGATAGGRQKFDLDLARARVVDIATADNNPTARRLDVEDVLYSTLHMYGIGLPNDFQPAPINFRPKWPVADATHTLSLADAKKVLAQTERSSAAWASAQTAMPQHTFRPGSHGPPTLSSGDNAMAILAGLMVVAVAASAVAPSSNQGDHGYDSGPYTATRPWWNQAGNYNSFQDYMHHIDNLSAALTCNIPLTP